MRTRNMTAGSPSKLIFTIAMPLMVGNIFQQLYTVVDAQVVGMVEGVGALAALGAADWFNWMFLGIIQGFTQGFAIPVAQRFGADDHEGMRRYVGNAVTLAVILAIILTITAILLIVPVLTVLDTKPEILPIAKDYLTVLFAGIPIVMAYNLMAGILRALGDGRSPLYAMIIASLINVTLDILFVAKFGWGVTGAAAATLIGQAFSSVYCFIRLRSLDFMRIDKSDLKPSGIISGRLIFLGIPIAAQNGIIAVGGMVVQSIVNKMEIAFIAGYTATNKMYGLLEIAALSYGYAVSTYAGQNLGAKEYDRIHKGVHSSAMIGVLTSCAIAGVMFIAGEAILGGFVSSEDPLEAALAVRYGKEFLNLMSLWLPVLYILHIYRSALQGMGNTVMPMTSGLIELGIRIAAALLLVGVIGYSGLFYAEVLAWLGADLILIPSYYIMMRIVKKRDMAEKNEA